MSENSFKGMNKARLTPTQHNASGHNDIIHYIPTIKQANKITSSLVFSKAVLAFIPLVIKHTHRSM